MNNSDLIKVLGKVAINPCGEFDTKTKYERLDLVTYGDCSYLAKKDTNGELPTNKEFWMLVTKSGKAGDSGMQGAQGSGFQGTQGERGETGVQGKTGVQGYCGLQGAQGEKGNQGNQGIQGEKGIQGSAGKQGSEGNQGTQGPQGIIGMKGNQGDEGKQGVRGIQGGDGTQGPQGIIGEKGNQGFQGVQGNQGSQGTQGYRGNQGFQGMQGTQGKQGNQGTRGAQGTQGTQGNQGTMGFQGFQGVQGAKGVDGSTGSNGVAGDVWMPVIDNDGWLRWKKVGYDSIEEPKEFMLIQEIEYYGWTKSAEPEITEKYKNDPQSYIRQEKPQLLTNVTPNSLFDRVDASEEMPYIWRRTNKNKNWECVDAYYVAAKVAGSISSVVINARLTYGAVTVETDLSWSVFPSDSGGTSWKAQDGFKFVPEKVIDGGGGEYSDSLYMSMERWNRLTKTCALTNKEALTQIYNAIKYSDPVSGFDWQTFKDYYDEQYPFSPFVIKFTNGVFTIQDIHELNVSNRVLNGLELYGSLTVFNSMNSFMQGSHSQRKKYRIDCGLKLVLNNSGCSMSIGNNTATFLPQSL